MKKLIMLGIMIILLISSASAFSNLTLLRDLVGFYDFEQPSGNLLDSSLQGNDGTVSNETNLVRGVNGIVGNGWQFGGNTSVTLKALQLAQDKNFTYSAWVNITGLMATTGTLVAEANATQGTPMSALQIGVDNRSKAQLRDNAENLIARTLNNLNDSVFHHILYTNNETSLVIYVDNVLVNSTLIPSGVLDVTTLSIGAVNQTNVMNSFLNGTLDRIALYNRSINSSEVDILYNNGNSFDPSLFLTFREKEFNATGILETSKQEYKINLTLTDGLTIQAATLIYNGSLFTGAISLNTAGNNYTISQSIFVPAIPIATGSQVMNFSWNVTVSDESTGIVISKVSNQSEQNVSELVFNLCNRAAGGTATESVLNFTLKDEFNGSIINAATNATTFQATFNIGADSENLLKNFSINNQSVATSEFDFCTNNETNKFFLDMNAFYSAVDFSDSNHFLSKAFVVGNVTSEIDLFLLRDSEAVQFFITVEEDLSPLQNAIVQVAKFFPGEGVFKTVEIDETDSDGKFTVFLELDKEYRFTVIKDGVALAIIERTSICEQAPCELKLSISSAIANIFEGFDNAFADDVLYNLSYNPFLKIVNFEFVDITGLATSFTLEIERSMTNQSAILISNQTVFTSSGSMSFNLTGQPDGDYMVRAYIQRSPNQLIDFLTIVLANLARELGLLGLFMTLIIVIATIFAVAITPKMMVLMVPLALTIPKLMGLSFLSPTTLVITWILGVVAFVIMK